MASFRGAGSFGEGFMKGINPFIEMSIKQKLMKQEQDLKDEAQKKQYDLDLQNALSKSKFSTILESKAVPLSPTMTTQQSPTTFDLMALQRSGLPIQQDTTNLFQYAPSLRPQMNVQQPNPIQPDWSLNEKEAGLLGRGAGGYTTIVDPMKRLEMQIKQQELANMSTPPPAGMVASSWNTGKTTYKPAGNDKKDKQEMFRNSTQTRTEFINRPEVKEYTTINTQVKSMDALLKNALSGDMNNVVALDQALITMYNKLTDPQSVVRESEYARTPQNLPIVNRISGAIEKLKKGGAGLTNDDRQALVQGAKVIAEERGKTFNTTLERYNNLANKYGIDPELITGGFQPHVVGGEQQGGISEEDIQHTMQLHNVSREEVLKRIGAQ